MPAKSLVDDVLFEQPPTSAIVLPDFFKVKPMDVKMDRLSIKKEHFTNIVLRGLRLR